MPPKLSRAPKKPAAGRVSKSVKPTLPADASHAQAKSLLLQRKNRLNDLMEKQSLLATYRVPKRDLANTSFEEDDGFIYKRGGRNGNDGRHSSKRSPGVHSPETDEGPYAKRKQMDSPFTRLDVKADALSREFANLSESTEDSLSDLSSSSKRITLNYPRPSEENNGARSKRRVSYHKRGKRALAIGNGLVAEPHHDVSPHDYYKLLDTSNSGPDRMRQLLVWCYKKKMQQDDQHSARGAANVSAEELATNNITRVICEEVLSALVEKKVSTSWYSQAKPSKPLVPRKKIVVPNAANAANMRSLQLFTERLHQIRREQQKWRNAHAKSETSLTALEAIPAQRLTPAHIAGPAENTANKGEAGISAEIAEVCSLICTKAEDAVRAANMLYAAGHRTAQALHAAAAISRRQIEGPASAALNAYMSRAYAPHLTAAGITVRDLLLRLRHPSQSAQERKNISAVKLLE